MGLREKPITFWFLIPAGVVCVIVGLVTFWSETKCAGCSPELFRYVDLEKREKAGAWVFGGMICYAIYYVTRGFFVARDQIKDQEQRMSDRETPEDGTSARP